MTPYPLARRLAAVLALATAACTSSPPTHFITLHRVPPANGPSPDTGQALAMGRVTLPPELDRDSLVRRASRDRIEVSPIVSWPADLDTVVRRTLAFDLAARLPDGRVVLPGQPRPPGALRLVVVTLERFSAGADDRVVLAGRWALVDAETQQPLLARDVHVEVPAESGNPDDIAGAMSLALGRLADQVVAELPQIATSRP